MALLFATDKVVFPLFAEPSLLMQQRMSVFGLDGLCQCQLCQHFYMNHLSASRLTKQRPTCEATHGCERMAYFGIIAHEILAVDFH